MNTQDPSPAPAKRLLVLTLILIGVCVGVSFLTTHLVIGNETASQDQPPGNAWLRHELNLTPAESARLDAFDLEYRQQREALLEAFQQRIDALSELLRTHDRYSDEVNDAVHRLHVVHGQLQTLSIEHYYDMLSVLPPDKQAKLREIAVEALSQPE